LKFHEPGVREPEVPTVTDSPQTGQVPPRTEYERRRSARREVQQGLEATDGRFATVRGLVFLVGLGLLWPVLVTGSIPPAWLFAPSILFVALVILHARTVQRLQRARRAVAFYDRGLQRLDDLWRGVGVSGERYLDPDHPCAGDLDLFGDGSLFQLLCGVRTRLGEDTLAAWLVAPAGPDEIHRRQQAVMELRGQTGFREELALLDAEVHDELDQNRLRSWVTTGASPVSRWKRFVSVILGILAAGTLVAWMSGFGLAPFLGVVLVEILFFATVLRDIRHAAVEADTAGSGLAILSQVLELIERQSFSSPLLRELRAELDTDGHPPSWQIARLRNLIQNLNNCLQNQFFAPLAFVLGLPVHVVHRVERWRERIGPHIPDWLAAVGQIEALTSLAGYSFERSDDPFPQIVSAAAGPCFEGTGIGHPLIPERNCIRNDVVMNVDHPLIMVSGSNMSGKSTLLRTVGVNAVLALAGAPVRASALRISPLVVGSAMRVQDSLQQGASLFYSVISRIRAIVELSGRTPPLLFLLDEILQGTNSHDRRVGAEGIIRQLIQRRAIGLVTTHDLALTAIVDSFGDRALNIHFEDHLVDGRMHFDYRICPGVVRKSNALELMRMIGLDVGERAAGQTSDAPGEAPQAPLED